MPLSAAKVLNQHEIDFFFNLCFTSMLIFSSTFYKKKWINSLYERNMKTCLIHLPIPSLVKGNETEERRFLPSTDTLNYTMFPKSGLLGQADTTSPITGSSYFCFVTSSESSQCCRMKQVSKHMQRFK